MKTPCHCEARFAQRSTPQFASWRLLRRQRPPPRNDTRYAAVGGHPSSTYLKLASTNFQFTRFQNASTYFGRALR